MTWADILLLLVAGTAAGTINTVVGSGSLVSFPALLAVGLPPVLANVTNNLGVLPGNVSGALAYRRELRGNAGTAWRLAIASVGGGVAGALLLLALPEEVFSWVVPVLIVLACVLIIAGPRIKTWLAARRAAQGAPRAVSGKLALGVGLTGVYGGYFGAAQGVILLSVLSIALPGGMQRANALKNVLAAAANGAAAIVFVLISEVHWTAAGLVAVGAIIGGQIGGRIGRRIPDLAYRIVIVAIGIVAIVHILFF
ncbi:sulfite exporter TauE/SafE family protein [Georgenia yuyongxinii]|uniref:Probable membrane transporter protein n=1 Tax=Georgenia yuyongxinii TaxID=2589797 RepID=A0A552WT11_9MICO|nr:sulfite exporter TauE/SafE family protein [Georgenia yuyongxinii]TRW45815.1 sulfite exporter TauE/SafE family protein [Georgenia yuyongxinii]